MAFLKGTQSEIPVKVVAKIDRGVDGVIEVPFTLIYRHVPLSKARVQHDQMLRDELTDDQVIRDNLIGWRDLKGEDGAEIPFSADVLAEMLEWVGYRNALVVGFKEAQFGRAAEKN